MGTWPEQDLDHSKGTHHALEAKSISNSRIHEIPTRTLFRQYSFVLSSYQSFSIISSCALIYFLAASSLLSFQESYLLKSYSSMPSSSPLDPKAAVFAPQVPSTSSKQLDPKAPAFIPARNPKIVQGLLRDLQASYEQYRIYH